MQIEDIDGFQETRSLNSTGHIPILKLAFHVRPHDIQCLAQRSKWVRNKIK